MHLHGDHLGALDLYDTRPHPWSEEEVECAVLLAAHATGYLANASRLDRARQTAAQLQEAPDSRVVIEQAKGVPRRSARDRGRPRLRRAAGLFPQPPDAAAGGGEDGGRRGAPTPPGPAGWVCPLGRAVGLTQA